MARKKTKRSSRGDYRVFVSHATTDKYLAKIVCEKVEAVGATAFRDDRDIGGGEDIPDKIRSEIVQCDELVVLLTPDSVLREWVKLEVGAAWGRYKLVVAILCHTKVVQIPAIIRSLKAFRLNDLYQYLSEVSDRVRKKQGAT